jgi:predicted RNA-binding Zn-ribbon protein involved in translation (DUF1610 family)
MSNVVVCSACNAQLRVPEGLVGKAVKCPKCGQVVSIPAPAEEELLTVLPVEEAADERQERESRQSTRPSRSRGQDDDDNDDGEEEEVRRPRRRRRRGRYAPCPQCGGTDASRIVWTFWGSFYGPALLTHVRCGSCGAAYNGNTGRSNLIAAIFFVLVPLTLIFLVLGLIAWWLLIGLPQRGKIRGEVTPIHMAAPALVALSPRPSPRVIAFPFLAFHKPS